MKDIKNKKELAVLISKLKPLEKPDSKLEQYQTDPEIAAEALWFAYMNRDIEGKVIADLGCGMGIFGLGALALKAKKVYLVDIDAKALNIAKENKVFLEKELDKKLNAIFINKEVQDFNKRVDVVIQNPPFGVQKTHSDKIFLLNAMKIAPKIYSFHKIESKNFIEKFVEENGFKVRSIINFKLPLKKTMFFHTKRVYYVDIGLWNIEK